jgi:probable HAF family extracellular repeat protein
MRMAIARIAIPVAAMMTVAASAGHFEASEEHQPSDYHVVDLPSLGGSPSRGNSINDLGLVAGYSTRTSGRSRHATAWFHGLTIDLGTLGGPNSSVAWPVKNNLGLIVGISQTNKRDPLGENWSCAPFFTAVTATGKTCLGFVWEWGVMRALPTLGGNNGFATGANNWRQIVGWAENTVHDSTCEPPQVLQFRPVVWGPERNQIRELPLFPGDTSGAATAINDRGQVVGISGICDQAVGRLTAAHAVLWDNGTVTNIGDLGAGYWNTPMAINQRGDVVGFAGQPGDFEGNRVRAFFWSKSEGIKSLGTLPGHVYSQANAINNNGQIVGFSCDAAFLDCRAVLWEEGEMTDLNDLREPGYTNLLINGQDINEFGVITGRARNPVTEDRPAFVATPNQRND